MTRFAIATAASAALLATAPGSARPDKECRTVRILDNGSRIEVDGPGGRASASSSASGGASASSSVSVSSSSHDGRRSSRVSSETRVDGKGRRVTTTHDDSGCTVTIDERDR